MYTDIEYADGYLAGRADWIGLDVETRNWALLEAQRAIDRDRYCGSAMLGQQQAFPRYGEEGIHENVKRAMCEEAYVLACRPDMVQRLQAQQSGVNAMVLGSASERFDGRMAHVLASPAARAYLRRWQMGSARIG